MGQRECFPPGEEIKLPSVNIKGSSEGYGAIGTSVCRISSWQSGGNKVTASLLSALSCGYLIASLADLSDFDLLNAQVFQDS